MDQTTPSTSEASNVSDAWRKKFDLFEELGADQKSIYKVMSSAGYKALGFRDKHKLSFNVLAFLFGPLYYFFKKMWAKGLILLAATWVVAALLTLAEAVIGATLPDICYWIPSAVICAQFANHDYYRHSTCGEKMWPGMPAILSKPAGIWGAPVFALVLLLGAALVTTDFGDETRTQILDDVSGVWRGNSDGAMISVALSGQNKRLEINGTKIPVTIQSIDIDNYITTLGVILNDGREVTWALRQLYDDAGERFTLQITLHDGTEDELSFVRNL